jgi:hypothetical protein
MLKKKGFEILIASPPDHNGLVAEIYCDGRFVALVSQERGTGMFDLETPGPDLVENQVMRCFDWVGFQNIVGDACQRLGNEIH